MAKSDDQDFAVGWTRRIAIRHRILFVNIFAVLILGGSIFYLDSFRSRLTQARIDQARTEAAMIARAAGAVPAERRARLLVSMGQDAGVRLRIYGGDGTLRADSWDGAPPTYEMRDPDAEPFLRDVGQIIDNVFDTIVGASQPPPLDIDAPDALVSWPEAQAALRDKAVSSALRRAPEGSAFVSAAASIEGADGEVLLLTVNAREIRRVVRSERLALAIILAVTIALSMLLSRFLARTIARPLRRLAMAAHRVRLGRSREVDVPRLPGRRDEIGLLARALHDMSHSLRARIDATEAFAADVTHELKNPLASLRSAVDSLERTKDPDIQAQLLDIVRHDVNRLDRLIVEIAETSRVDAELSRARFEPVDMGELAAAMVPGWEMRAADRARIVTERQGAKLLVAGDESRLARLLDNLVDNALSFSPPAGIVRVRVAASGDMVTVTVEDEGPGIAADRREAIFTRFHSDRPDEEFGNHSGLGLAIVRAIAEGHDGSVTVGDRPDGRTGARFVLTLPRAAA